MLHPLPPLNDREVLIEIYHAVAAANTKLDKVEAVLDKQNGRVRRLELWRAWITGGLAVVGLVAVSAAGLVLRFLLLGKL